MRAANPASAPIVETKWLIERANGMALMSPAAV